MRLIKNILFPVNFSSSCIAMTPYVKKAAVLFGARVSLIHVFDPGSHSGFELYVRRSVEIAEEHQEIARNRLNSFLQAEFPVSENPRILVAGDAAAQIAEVARNGFDLIIMPTHTGTFRRMLLGSTTAKVLNDADCPVLTSTHAETIAPRPLAHREWLCAIGLEEDSERVLRSAHRIAQQAQANLIIIHALQTADSNLPVQMDLAEQIQSREREQARQRITDLQRRIESEVPVQIVVGPTKQALLEAARQFDGDLLIIGRSPESGTYGRIRDLTYTVVRDAPFPVLSV
jgi:nucleotide-binding universal stress UspA family protein